MSKRGGRRTMNKGERRIQKETPEKTMQEVSQLAREMTQTTNAVMAKAEAESRRIAREAAKQVEELGSRTVPWWSGMWGMWDAADMARSWMGLTWRLWDVAASSVFGKKHETETRK